MKVAFNLRNADTCIAHLNYELCSLWLSLCLSLSLTQKRLACVSVCPLSWWYMSVGVRNIKCWRSKGRRRHLKKYVQFLPPRPPRPPPFPCGQNLQTPSIVLASVALWYGDIISFSILLIYWVWRIVSMYDMLYNLLQCSLDGFTWPHTFQFINNKNEHLSRFTFIFMRT